MKKNLLLILVFFIQQTFSQSDYRKGYIITKNGDSISGFVNYRVSFNKYKKIDFKRTLTSEVTEYLPTTILAYGISNDQYFVSKKIDSKTNDDVFFFESLVSGKANLFKLNNDFFIEKDTVFMKLENDIKKVYKNGGEYLFSTKRYIGTLTYLLADCKKNNKKITETKYKETNLVALISDYNNCNNKGNIVYKENKPWIKVNFGALLGYNFTSINNSNSDKQGIYFPNSNGISNSVTFGGFLEVNAPRVIERYSFYTGIIYSTTNYYKYQQINDNLFELREDHKQLKVPVALRYTFPKKEITPFLTIGMLNIINLKTSTTWYSELKTGPYVFSSLNNYNLYRNSIGLILGLGVKKDIKDNLEMFIDFNYEYFKTNNLPVLISNNTYKNTVSNFQLLIGIRL